MAALIGVIAILVAMAGLVVGDLLEHRSERDDSLICPDCAGVIYDRRCPTCRRIYEDRWPA